jgi:hypothetical protein
VPPGVFKGELIDYNRARDIAGGLSLEAASCLPSRAQFFYWVSRDSTVRRYELNPNENSTSATHIPTMFTITSE